jgi:hypothetical protein
MKRWLTALATAACLTTQASAGDSGWVKVPNEQALGHYIFNEAEWARSNYPTKVECRSRGGKLQARFTYVRAIKETKPYHKWNATILRAGESQAQAAARLPVSDHPEAKYQVKLGCIAAGKTLVVVFRGTRALD